jgi:2-phospho-L-lactate/phosphoenolpyruvate guanylyltransferase
MTWAVVPLKSPEQAKSRLSAALAPAGRIALFFSMARHVIRTVRESQGVSGVIVVTSSTQIAGFAKAMDCRVVLQSEDAGTSSAFEAGVAQACAEGLSDLLMLPGDLPLLSSRAVERFMRSSGTPASVTIAPDESGQGTNALLCSPPDAIPLYFGPASFHRHAAAARQRGAALRIVKLRELAFDVDRQSDLARLPRGFKIVTGLREPELACPWHAIAERTPT